MLLEGIHSQKIHVLYAKSKAWILPLIISRSGESLRPRMNVMRTATQVVDEPHTASPAETLWSTHQGLQDDNHLQLCNLAVAWFPQVEICHLAARHGTGGNDESNLSQG